MALIRSVTKVLNEQDVWPAEMLRHVAMEARLLGDRFFSFDVALEPIEGARH